MSIRSGLNHQVQVQVQVYVHNHAYTALHQTCRKHLKDLCCTCAIAVAWPIALETLDHFLLLSDCALQGTDQVLQATRMPEGSPR